MSGIPSAALSLLAAVLVLSACTPAEPAPAAEPDAAAEPEPAADTQESRAEAAGLSDRDVAALDSLGVPVYVPVLPDGWTLDEVTARTVDGGDSTSFPEYVLRVRTAEETCLEVHAASEGIGDLFVEEPPHERDVRVPGVPTGGPARLGWGIAGETTEGWEDGRVATEWFEAGDFYLAVLSNDADGCRPGSPEAAETLLGSLRPLDPDDDAGPDGTSDPVEDDSSETAE